MRFNVLLLFAYSVHGFYILLICGSVLHGFDRLLIFDYVLFGCHCVADLCMGLTWSLHFVGIP